jgi:hypothetical protein
VAAFFPRPAALRANHRSACAAYSAASPTVLAQGC